MWNYDNSVEVPEVCVLNFFHPRISLQPREDSGENGHLSRSTMDGPESPWELSESHGDVHVQLQGEVWSNQDGKINLEWAE